jgi:thioredoxin 1
MEKKMKVLKFYATWCGPCKGLTTTLNGMADKISMPIEEVDIDSNMDVARKYNVRSVPTMVVVDDTGAEVKRVVGMMNETQVLEFLEA